MVVTKPVDIRKEQKKYFSIAYKGEPVVVSRPRNENVVVISENEYNRLLTLSRLSAYYEGITEEPLIDISKVPRKRTIGIAEGIELCNPEYDFDESNEEIAKLFGVV